MKCTNKSPTRLTLLSVLWLISAVHFFVLIPETKANERATAFAESQSTLQTVDFEILLAEDASPSNPVATTFTFTWLDSIIPSKWGLIEPLSQRWPVRSQISSYFTITSYQYFKTLLMHLL